MRNRRITTAIAGLSVAAIAGGIAFAATAGGSTGPSTNASASTTISPSPTAAGPNGVVPPAAATVRAATATIGGSAETILVDSKGLPLYFYKPDSATQSMVTGSLAALWPPLVASAPTASGAATGTLKVVPTFNGRQVTYNGHFLYTFVEDSPGHVTGQGVQNFYVATPAISVIGPMTSGAATTSPVHGGSGSGY